MGDRGLSPIAVLLACLLAVSLIASLRIESAYSYSDNTIEGDFSILWYSESVLHYDKFYVVAPNAVFKETSLIYGRDTVCRSLSITISSIGVYAFHTAINGSRQYVYVDGGMVEVQLTNLSTGDAIVDRFAVPGLYAIYVSIVPSAIWIRDTVTGVTTRMQQLSLYVEGYGVENVRRSYNISGILPTIDSLVVSSMVYNAVRAINHYITMYIEYPQKSYNVLIVFAPRAEDQQQTVTTVATVTETKTITITPPPAVTTVTTTLVLEETREVTRTSTITSVVPTYITVVETLYTTATVEKTIGTTIERSTTVTFTTTQTIEKGYSIYTLVGVAIVSVLVSVSLTLLFVLRRPSKPS